ncbi:PA14 domain-containing protein [Planctomycetota bacterium]
MNRNPGVPIILGILLTACICIAGVVLWMASRVQDNLLPPSADILHPVISPDNHIAGTTVNTSGLSRQADSELPALDGTGISRLLARVEESIAKLNCRMDALEARVGVSRSDLSIAPDDKGDPGSAEADRHSPGIENDSLLVRIKQLETEMNLLQGRISTISSDPGNSHESTGPAGPDVQFVDRKTIQHLSKQYNDRFSNLVKELQKLKDDITLARSRHITSTDQVDAYYGSAYYPGIVGHYFNGKNFEEFARSRIDRQIYFNWQTGGVDILSDRSEEFSVRWKGVLEIPKKGRYHFHAKSDDGVRVYLGRHIVIMEWNDHAPQEDITEVELDEGYYPLKVEYYENHGYAVVELYWESEHFDRELIPAKYYYHTNSDE